MKKIILKIEKICFFENFKISDFLKFSKNIFFQFSKLFFSSKFFELEKNWTTKSMQKFMENSFFALPERFDKYFTTQRVLPALVQKNINSCAKCLHGYEIQIDFVALLCTNQLSVSMVIFTESSRSKRDKSKAEHRSCYQGYSE